MKTHSGANQLLCPIFTLVHVAAEVAVAASGDAPRPEGAMELARNAGRCRGHECMAWRWYATGAHVPPDQRLGYCGLAGLPPPN